MKTLLCSMRPEHITQIVKTDSLIIESGTRLLSHVGSGESTGPAEEKRCDVELFH